MSDRPSSPTVLFVDDDPFFLALARKALAAEGWRVLTTSDPLRALPQLEWEHVDVLATDVAMPEVDGVDLVTRARRLFPHVPRILVTAGASLERAARAVNEGEIFRLLVKPVEEEDLREAIRAAMALRERLRELDAADRRGAWRQTALFELERRHPGIGSVETREGVYLVGESRIADLQGRFRGTALGRIIGPEPGPVPPSSGLARVP